ncbi:MAG: ABC transporter ATP-binding protein [Lachnospiraceae bacterium]|nr:ABC transporter ATP-binding protein [Lachnospiraceae bacterium]
MSLKIDNIYFSYKNHPVLKGVSFEAGKGELISVLGPNGVGKSTLFKCILGLLKPEQGDVIINGTSLKEMTPAMLAREIAYIPQFHNPVFSYTVFDMVLMGTTAQMSKLSVPKEEQMKYAEEALKILDIYHLKDRNYANISGGERQMTLIARAIAQQAKILIMDEPSASLDFGNKIRLMKTVRTLTNNGYTVIQSTHDPEQACFYSSKILAMYDGQNLAFGRPPDIIDSRLISKLYGMDIDVINLDRQVISCVPKDLHRMNKELSWLTPKFPETEETIQNLSE